MYAYHGSEMMTITFFVVLSKLGISAAVLLGFIAIVMVFKPRV